MLPLLLNQVEQVLFYIAGFGFSDLFIQEMQFTKKQKLFYYIFLTLVATTLLYHTGNN
jgi:hypothetical protein